MIVKTKKIIGCLLTLIVFSSCEKKFDFDNYDVTLANLFSIYADDIEKDIIFLNEKVEMKQSKQTSLSNSLVDSINITISDYYNYLNDLDLKSSKLHKNLFYEENTLTEEGKIFKEKSEEFISKLDRLIVDKDLKDYLRHFFNVDDVKNQDDLYLKYLDYYYLGAPYPVFKYLIKKRKLDLITFKNELVNSDLYRNK